MSDIATLGTIEHIDPTQIEVETNIRTLRVLRADRRMEYPLSEVEQIAVRAEGVDSVTVRAGTGEAISDERTGFDGDTAA